MSEIQDLMKTINSVKSEDQKKFIQLKYKRNKNLNPKSYDPNFEVKLRYKQLLQGKEELHDEIKKRYRMAWKAPGYVNENFGQQQILRARVLNSWEMQRALIAERSYKYPENYKGFKNPTYGKNFGQHSLSLYPKPFQQQIVDSQLKYVEFLMRPSKFGKLPIQEKIDRVSINNKEPFRLTNSVQFNEFGRDSHDSFETTFKSARSFENTKKNNTFNNNENKKVQFRNLGQSQTMTQLPNINSDIRLKTIKN